MCGSVFPLNLSFLFSQLVSTLFYSQLVDGNIVAVLGLCVVLFPLNLFISVLTDSFHTTL
jgi:hypothetical protein